MRLANKSSYGLAASIWTDDLSRAVRVADALSPQTPFGGMKQSGFGCDLSLHSFGK